MAKIALPRRCGTSSERELIALVGVLKAEGLVKTVRVGGALVRAKLDAPAAALAPLLDRPFDHRPADAAAAFAGGDAHALDLAAPHAAPGEPGNKAELQNADYLTPALGNREKLVGVALDRGESVVVPYVQACPGVLAFAAERVVGEQRHNRCQIVRVGPAKGHPIGIQPDPHFLHPPRTTLPTPLTCSLQT